MSEWIKYDGLGMPVKHDVIVSVKTKDGEKSDDHWNTKADEWDWDWVNGNGDITHYKIIKGE